MKVKDVKIDCRFLRGDIPCKPNKLYGVHCVDENGKDCIYYDQTKEKILIIKLAAIGDVIRTTPLLERLKKDFPQAKIYWLTKTPSIVPDSADTILEFTPEAAAFLQSVEFDYVFNLDKDKEACGLTNILHAENKKGYIIKDGVPFPSDKNAEHKYLTGLFDDISKKNTKNYLEEIFEVCGFKYSGEKYILSSFGRYSSSWNFDKSKKIIGLNTGCGGRWVSRLWADERWIGLAKSLLAKNYEVVFLGGAQEDEKNKKFAEHTGGKYPGHFHLEKFINLVNQCDLVVTGVTMAMHITIGLSKKIVLFNNIFNKNEFELFNLGEIIEPSRECKCFYSTDCINPDYKCMEYIEVERVLNSIDRLLAE